MIDTEPASTDDNRELTEPSTDAPLWGIDLGARKIECVVLESVGNPRVIQRSRVDAESEEGYHHVLSNIQKLVLQVSWDTGLTPGSIGFGTPGTLNPATGLMRGCNSQHLQDTPLKSDLEELLAVPVAVENDANCFALAETRMGVIPTLESNIETVFGVILGTGVGGGLVVNDRLIRGRNLIGGEWGHNFLDRSGGPCYCGKNGCVETLISGPALEDYYAQQSGSSLPLVEIAMEAGQDNEHAIATIERLVEFFGLGIAALINIIDPDVIVVGGGVGNIDALYEQGVEQVSQHIFSPTMGTQIVKPLLGDSAGVFGAAFLHA